MVASTLQLVIALALIAAVVGGGAVAVNRYLTPVGAVNYRSRTRHWDSGQHTRYDPLDGEPFVSTGNETTDFLAEVYNLTGEQIALIQYLVNQGFRVEYGRGVDVTTAFFICQGQRYELTEYLGEVNPATFSNVIGGFYWLQNRAGRAA